MMFSFPFFRFLVLGRRFFSGNDHHVVVEVLVPPDLLVGQRDKVLPALTGQEKCPADDVIGDAPVVGQRAVIGHIQDFRLLVANLMWCTT